MEIEEIANEWVRREYFRQSMEGKLASDGTEEMTEDKFKESVWDTAMAEAEVKYKQMKGEVDDDFKLQQERKQEIMLKRAKDDLASIMQEDPNKTPPSTDDSDDDDNDDDDDDDE